MCGDLLIQESAHFIYATADFVDKLPDALITEAFSLDDPFDTFNCIHNFRYPFLFFTIFILPGILTY